MAEVYVRYLGKHVKALGVGPNTGKYTLLKMAAASSSCLIIVARACSVYRQNTKLQP